MSKVRQKIRLKKGDQVVVIAGGFATRDDDGRFDQVGPIVEIDREKQRVRIDGVSSGKKKTIARRGNNPGQLVDRHEWIHISNVMKLEKYKARCEKRGKGQAEN